MLKVKWTQASLQDMQETVDYINQRNPQAARGVAKKFHEASLLLQEIPSLGREGRYPNMQEWVVSGIPYTLWYRVNNAQNILEILRDLHDARQRPSNS